MMSMLDMTTENQALKYSWNQLINTLSAQLDLVIQRSLYFKDFMKIMVMSLAEIQLMLLISLKPCSPLEIDAIF